LGVRALTNSSRRGDLVLDTFLGSGSLLIACESLGRRCYGVELDPKYCDAIIRRYSAFVDDPDTILHGFDQCLRELNGEVSSIRKPWRTLIRVADINTEAGQPVADVCIPAWNPNERVRLPVALITKDIDVAVNAGMRFFARVNIGAENADELFFENFEAASKPISEDAAA